MSALTLVWLPQGLTWALVKRDVIDWSCLPWSQGWGPGVETALRPQQLFLLVQPWTTPHLGSSGEPSAPRPHPGPSLAFGTCVHPIVRLQLVLEAELLATAVALVGLLSGVDALVALECALIPEATATELTLVRVVTCGDMGGQAPALHCCLLSSSVLLSPGSGRGITLARVPDPPNIPPVWGTFHCAQALSALPPLTLTQLPLLFSPQRTPGHPSKPSSPW